jgi:hypothetical protein
MWTYTLGADGERCYLSLYMHVQSLRSRSDKPTYKKMISCNMPLLLCFGGADDMKCLLSLIPHLVNTSAAHNYYLVPS